MNTDKKISLGVSIGGGVVAIGVMAYIIYDIYRENKKVYIGSDGDLATKLESKYPRREKLDDDYSLDKPRSSINPRSEEGGKRHRKTRGKKRRSQRR